MEELHLQHEIKLLSHYKFATKRHKGTKVDPRHLMIRSRCHEDKGVISDITFRRCATGIFYRSIKTRISRATTNAQSSSDNSPTGGPHGGARRQSRVA